MMLIVTPPMSLAAGPSYRTAVFFARIVMPFSRSRSIESMTRSLTEPSSAWCEVKALDCHSMASTSVVLPWSTWATIAMLRMSARDTRGVSAGMLEGSFRRRGDAARHRAARLSYGRALTPVAAAETPGGSIGGDRARVGPDPACRKDGTQTHGHRSLFAREGEDHREDPPYGPVVGRPAADLHLPGRVDLIRDRPGLHAEVLLGRHWRPGVPALPDPLLLPLRLRGLHPGLERVPVPAGRVVAAVRGADAAVPAAVPHDLLLLPQGVLPRLLAVAARLRRRGAAREVHGRDALPAPGPEPAPLLLLRGRGHLAHQHLRRGARVPRRERQLRHRPRHRHPLDQRHRALGLHGLL